MNKTSAAHRLPDSRLAREPWSRDTHGNRLFANECAAGSVAGRTRRLADVQPRPGRLALQSRREDAQPRQRRASSSRSGDSPPRTPRRRSASFTPRRPWSRGKSTSARPLSPLSTSSRRTASSAGSTAIRPARPVLPPTDGAPDHREAAGRGVGSRHLQLGAGRRTGPFTSRIPAAGCTASTPAPATSGGRSIAVRPTFPGAHWNNLLMASPILADGKVIFGGGTLEQTLRRHQGSTPAAPAAASLWRSTRRPARSSGSTTSARSRKSSIRRSSLKGPGASTSSSTAPRRAASGPRRRTIPKPTRCSSAPT